MNEPTTAISPNDVPAAPKEHLTPLPPIAIRARQRPWAIFHVYLYELIFSLVIATPVYAWAQRAWGGHPDGDAVLWQPGGHYLATWVLQPETTLAVVSRTTLTLLAVSAIALQIPLGALCASLAFARDDDTPGLPDPRRSMRWTSALRIGMASFMALAGLFVLSLLASGIVAGLGVWASGAMSHRLAEGHGEVKAFEARLAVLAVFGVPLAFVGVIADLARAAIARSAAIATAQGTPLPGLTLLGRGIRAGLRAARRSLLPGTVAWAWRALAGLALIAVGYAVTGAIGGRGGLSLVGIWVLHQLIVLVRTALRASWLARALRYVS